MLSKGYCVVEKLVRLKTPSGSCGGRRMSVSTCGMSVYTTGKGTNLGSASGKERMGKKAAGI